jgi:glutamate-ammonia-ligase adenylyltransferase
VLAHAARYPGLLGVTANIGLIEACRAAGLLDANQAAILSVAHADLLQRALACTLDLRSRIAPRDRELEQLCASVHDVTTALGFAFAVPVIPTY